MNTSEFKSVIAIFIDRLHSPLTHIQCSPITTINFQSYEHKQDDLLPSLRIRHPDNFFVGSTGVNTLHIQRGD